MLGEQPQRVLKHSEIALFALCLHARAAPAGEVVKLEARYVSEMRHDRPPLVRAPIAERHIASSMA
jgi:hypothetical protein